MALGSARSDHPLAGDARDTLRRLHRHATMRANRQDRRLVEEPDSLPRGPLPVMARTAAARTEALHLLIALAALGDEEACRRLRRCADQESMPASYDLVRLGAAWDRFADELHASRLDRPVRSGAEREKGSRKCNQAMQTTGGATRQ